MRELRSGRVGELDVHVVANIGDGGAANHVLDLADEVDERVLGASALGQCEFASREF